MYFTSVWRRSLSSPHRRRWTNVSIYIYISFEPRVAKYWPSTLHSNVSGKPCWTFFFQRVSAIIITHIITKAYYFCVQKTTIIMWCYSTIVCALNENMKINYWQCFSSLAPYINDFVLFCANCRANTNEFIFSLFTYWLWLAHIEYVGT